MPTDIDIKPISKEHNNLINDFKTYEPELKKYLVEDALNDQEINLSKTFLLFYKNNLVGYITLLCDSLRLEGEVKNTFQNKGIFYKNLPAIKIGRLAVDDRYQRQGFGKQLIELAGISARRIFEKYCGCRFLILDAKRNKDKSKDSLHFYKKLNFHILKEREKGTTPMYLDLIIDSKL